MILSPRYPHYPKITVSSSTTHILYSMLHVRQEISGDASGTRTRELRPHLRMLKSGITLTASGQPEAVFVLSRRAAAVTGELRVTAIPKSSWRRRTLAPVGIYVKTGRMRAFSRPTKKTGVTNARAHTSYKENEWALQHNLGASAPAKTCLTTGYGPFSPGASMNLRQQTRALGLYMNEPESMAALALQNAAVAYTRRGYPDFTVIRDGEIYGFIEVKPRSDKNLRKDQEVFKRFCEKHNIPFLLWSPDMGEKAIRAWL